MRIIFALLLSLWATSACALSLGNAGPAYPCTLLALDTTAATHSHQVLTFTSAADVSTFFGSGTEATVANAFFAAGARPCTNQAIKFVRFPVVAARAHLDGGNLASTISSLTPATGTVTLTSQGDTWQSSSMSLVTTGAASAILSGNATALQAALNGANNQNLPTKATTTGSTLTPATCTFVGYLSYLTLNVTANGTCGSGGPPIAAQVCDTGAGATFSDSPGYAVNHFPSITAANCTGGQTTSGQENLINSASYLNNATTQNPGAAANLETYSMFLRQTGPNTTNAGVTFTAYWQVLRVGTWVSGTIAAGQQLEDGGSLTNSNLCVIWSNLTGATSGSGPTGVATGSAANGSTWLVACADPTVTVAAEAISTSDCALEVVPTTPTAGPSGRAFEEISVSNYCPYFAASIGYLTDNGSTIAGELMLTQGSGAGASAAFAETPGYLITNAAAGMNAVAALDRNFGTFVWAYSPYNATTNTNYQGGPGIPYGVDPALQAWSQAQPGQWPYYYEGWGGSAPPGGNFPWAR